MAANTATRREVAYVVKDGYGFQVVPPVVKLSPGQVLRLHNRTHTSVLVRFPEDVMTPPRHAIASHGSNDFTVLSTAQEGVYDYEVTVILVAEDESKGIKAVTLQARGGSPPRIIIDF